MLSRCLHPRPIFLRLRPAHSLVFTEKEFVWDLPIDPPPPPPPPLEDSHDTPKLTRTLLSRKDGRLRQDGLAMANILTKIEELEQEDPRHQPYYVTIIKDLAQMGLHDSVDVLIRCMLFEETPITKETWAAIIAKRKAGRYIWERSGIPSKKRLKGLFVRSETGEKPNPLSMFSLLEAMNDNVIRKSGLVEELEWVIKAYTEVYGTDIPVDFWGVVLEAYIAQGQVEQTKIALERITSLPSYNEDHTLQQYLDASPSASTSRAPLEPDTAAVSPALICLRHIIRELALDTKKKVTINYLESLLSKYNANRHFQIDEWNDVLSILLRCGDYDRAFQLFEGMLSTSEESSYLSLPNGQTFQILLSSYQLMQRRRYTQTVDDTFLTSYSPRALLSKIVALDKRPDPESTPSNPPIFSPPTLNAFLGMFMRQRDYAAAFVTLSLFDPTAFLDPTPTSKSKSKPKSHWDSFISTAQDIPFWVPKTKRVITNRLLNRVKTTVERGSALGRETRSLRPQTPEDEIELVKRVRPEGVPLRDIIEDERRRDNIFYRTFLGTGKLGPEELDEVFLNKLSRVRWSLIPQPPHGVSFELAFLKRLLRDAITAEVMSGLPGAKKISLVDQGVMKMVDEGVKECMREVIGTDEVEIKWGKLGRDEENVLEKKAGKGAGKGRLGGESERSVGCTKTRNWIIRDRQSQLGGWQADRGERSDLGGWQDDRGARREEGWRDDRGARSDLGWNAHGAGSDLGWSDDRGAELWSDDRGRVYRRDVRAMKLAE
ncbi:hypothetical protein M422DRAFT_32238, partial [Sphaerobolus stellatus SS14]